MVAVSSVEPSALWLKEAYIGYRTVLHRLSLEGGERVVEAKPYEEVRARVRAFWREAFEPTS